MKHIEKKKKKKNVTTKKTGPNSYEYVNRSDSWTPEKQTAFEEGLAVELRKTLDKYLAKHPNPRENAATYWQIEQHTRKVGKVAGQTVIALVEYHDFQDVGR